MSIGIDIVLIPRFEHKEALAKRILSPSEFLIYEKRADKVRFIAGRFAAKEAFLKAVRGGFGQIAFSHISVLYDDLGIPYLEYLGQRYDVSISHDGEYAVAVVQVPDGVLTKAAQ